MEIGYTMMCEQAGPKQLVRDVVLAEQADFDFSVISDHYVPWLEAQGHSGYAWSILGAAAQATERIPLMTFVTCPTMRYHPAVVAQKAATMALLSDGRFALGLGAGENLNEHVVGAGWPPADVRHEMLVEAVEIIRALWEGEYVNYRGDHFDVESAKLWDLPDTPPLLGIAASGAQSVELAAEYGDALITTDPDADLVASYDVAAGPGHRKYGQIPVCFGPDEAACRAKARDLWRWSAAGWKVMAELPGPAAFDAYSQFVREEDVAAMVPCGPDLSVYVDAVREYATAGFTHLALVQVGGDQQAEFVDWAAKTLLPALRR